MRYGSPVRYLKPTRRRSKKPIVMLVILILVLLGIIVYCVYDAFFIEKASVEETDSVAENEINNEDSEKQKSTDKKELLVEEKVKDTSEEETETDNTSADVIEAPVEQTEIPDVTPEEKPSVQDSNPTVPQADIPVAADVSNTTQPQQNSQPDVKTIPVDLANMPSAQNDTIENSENNTGENN